MLSRDLERSKSFCQHLDQVLFVDNLLSLFVLVAEQELDRLLGERVIPLDSLEDLKNQVTSHLSSKLSSVLQVLLELGQVDPILVLATLIKLGFSTLFLLGSRSWLSLRFLDFRSRCYYWNRSLDRLGLFLFDLSWLLLGSFFLTRS